jgi:hypothetical protein
MVRLSMITKETVTCCLFWPSQRASGATVNRSTTVQSGISRATAAGVGLLFVTAVLAGCSGSSDQGGTADPPPSTSAAGAATTSSDADQGAGGGAVSADELCAALKQMQPELDKLTTPVGAMAQLTVGIANVWDEKGALEQLGAADLDAMVARSCPEAGAAALKSAGVDSFSQL